MEPIIDGERLFIEFLVSYIVETNPGDLYTNVDKISKHLQEKFDPLDPLNKYRKSFGNLKDCVKSPGTKRVLRLDGTSFRFCHITEVEAAHEDGILTDSGWMKYHEGQSSYWTKHLTMCKQNKMNVCKTAACEKKYFEKANKPGQCKLGGEHQCIPRYDFTKSENVHECEI